MMLRMQIKYFHILKRTYAFDKYNSLSIGEQLKASRNKLTPDAYVLLLLPATAFGLSIWQIFRRKEKLDRISLIKTRTQMDPVDLPLDLRELSDMEYTPVKLVGEFLHDKEFVIVPRQRLDENFPTTIKGVTFFDLGCQHGGLVVTPFKPVDRDYTVLVSRGWVPRTKLDPESRLEGQVKGQVEIVGITRNPEKKPRFVSSSDPERDFYPFRDILTMARFHDTAPHYFELIYKDSAPFGPIGGQTLISLPNNHHTYILTWFAVGATMSWLWWSRFMKYVPK